MKRKRNSLCKNIKIFMIFCPRRIFFLLYRYKVQIPNMWGIPGEVNECYLKAAWGKEYMAGK